MPSPLAPIDPASIAFVHGQIGGRTLAPFAREIFLLETHVAGTSYRELDDIASTIVVDARLTVARDPNNEFDKLAIRVLDAAGVDLGFVPREKNEVLARLLDAGKSIVGRVSAVRHFGGWLRIDVRWFLDDF